jgi:heat shock protein HslJ
MTMDDEAPAAGGRAASRPKRLPLIPIPVLVIALALAVVFAVGAEWTDNDTLSAAEGLPDLQQELAAHEWLLDRTDSSLSTDDANPVTLAFGEDRVSGMGPCNSYRGRLSVDDDDNAVEISNIAQTLLACPEGTMRAEDEYFTVLQQVRDADLPDGYDRNRLVLTNDSGDRLAFDALDVEELIVGTWNIVNVARDDGIESVLDATEPTLDFGDDGDFALDTACNRVRGRYELEGDRLFVGSLAKTLRECPEPAGVMDQEAALVRALDAGVRVAVIPGQLTILDRAGNIMLVAVQPDASR